MALTVSDILHDADAFRRAYPDWPHPSPEEQVPAPAAAPVYRAGDRVTHLGHAATVAHGNVPDEWGAPAAVNIRYDRAPRGHSPQKDVLASEVTLLAEGA